MITSILKTLFLISKTRVNKKGLAPVICRITYNKKRKQFYTGFFVKIDSWNNKQQLAQPPNEENNFVNTQLGLIKNEINQAFLFLQVNQVVFDVEDIYLQYKGENIKQDKTILEMFEIHNSKMKKLVGREYSNATYKKFTETRRYTSAFIRKTYKKNDFMLSALTLKFIEDFDYYLKTTKNQSQSTINKHIQRLRKIVKLALGDEFIKTNPFVLYKAKKVIKKVVFLSTEELKDLEEYNFVQSKLLDVKNLFVFCCYTGLAYQEMSRLTTEHIKLGFDGNLWIEMYRQKTKSNVSVPILPKAEKILNYYNNELPKISNQKFNSYLKEIAGVVGIEKNLTHHVARKTFATTVLLYNGVSMEVVSELLGHSKITITQDYYAKVVKRKVSKEIVKLNKKLGQG